MSDKFYEVWCEWDIGHDDMVFTTEAIARRWVLENENLQEVADDQFDGSIENIFTANLVGIQEKTLYK
jgi:hypothetical protein